MPARWLEAWKAQWRRNEEEAEANSRRTGSPGDRCRAMTGVLLREIVVNLSMLTIDPADFFDRPELVELTEAARYATGRYAIGLTEEEADGRIPA